MASPFDVLSQNVTLLVTYLHHLWQERTFRWFIIGYLLFINGINFATFGWDKSRSRKKGAWRVPEKRFFLLSLFGGSVGALLGMHFFHHKTKHWYFRVGLPLILLLQLTLVWYLSWLGG